MAKYTVVGDPHIKPSNLDQIDALFNMVEDMGRPVIWLGDMLDTKEIVRSKCFNTLYKYLKNSKLDHTILVGNHDWHNLECEEHSLLALKELNNVTIVDRPMPNTFNNVLLMPYYHDLELFKADVRKWGRDRKTLIMHQGLNGFDFGNGYIEDKGLDLDSLPNFECIISGHFHMYQEMIERNLTYVGTPFSHSFGENEQFKCVVVYDTETVGITEVIPTGFPQHITIEFNCDKDILEGLKKDVSDNNIYRIILTGSEEAVTAFDKSQFPDVKFIERPDSATSVAIHENVSNEEKFQRWAKEVKQLDPETMALGMEILSSVS